MAEEEKMSNIIHMTKQYYNGRTFFIIDPENYSLGQFLDDELEGNGDIEIFEYQFIGKRVARRSIKDELI